MKIYTTGLETVDADLLSAVDIENNATVEANDRGIGKVTCAVSYSLRLRKLIGRLAENGYMRRANVLAQLVRRSGETMSNRVRFTVKPTATQGQKWVEVLP